MRYVVDSIEDKIVTLENENCDLIRLPLSQFPYDIKEGSVLTFDGTNFIFLQKETSERRKRIFDKLNNLKNSNK